MSLLDGKCDRCFRQRTALTGSYFDTAMICLGCDQLERAMPEYESAKKAEAEACKRGDFNFPGVGLPMGRVVPNHLLHLEER